MFSGEGLFILNISGRGTVFLSSYGAIHAINLAPGEEYIVEDKVFTRDNVDEYLESRTY